MHRSIAPFLLLLPAAAADALAQAPAAANPPPAELAGSLFQMLSGLAVVIALLFACLWLIRRLAAPRGSAAAAIRVLGAAAVGPRERVVLVRLGEQVLVLGVAPGRVTKLHEMKPEDLPQGGSPLAAPSMPAAAQRSFSAWLRQATERRDAR